MIDEIRNEVKYSSQTNNVKYCSNCQDPSMDNFVDYNYIVSSYQRLFDEIKEELICPISFSQLEDPICLNSGQTIDKSTYEMLTSNNLNNPFTRQPIGWKDKIIMNYTVSRILQIVRKFEKITPKVNNHF